MNIEETLIDRGGKYGSFAAHADITQRLKEILRSHYGWKLLTDDKCESLEMIMHKIGRIMCGDPEYKDSWHDIVGYAKLIDDSLDD